MKNNKSQLDIFLLKRIEDNRKALRHNLDSTLQEEQVCFEEIVKGTKHYQTNENTYAHNDYASFKRAIENNKKQERIILRSAENTCVTHCKNINRR